MFKVVKNRQMERIMSLTLLAAVLLISCNVKKVTKDDKSKSETIACRSECVVIDPGHGGKDPGKVGVSGMKEKDINLSMSMTLRDELKKEGFRVMLTRDSDRVLNEGSRFSKIGDLNNRCKIINQAYEQNNRTIMISIHQNSFVQNSVHGAQCFYYQRSEESRALAEGIQSELNSKINIERAKKSKPNDSYYILINTKCPGCIVEFGFLSNPEEERKLTDKSYQQQLSKILVNCIKKYFERNK